MSNADQESNKKARKSDTQISVRLNIKIKEELERIAELETRSISQQAEHFIKIGIQNYCNDNLKTSELDNYTEEKANNPITIRLNPEIKELLENIAKKETRTLSQQIEHFIKEGIKIFRKKNPEILLNFWEDIAKLGVTLWLMDKQITSINSLSNKNNPLNNK